jgi:hypothetical protein
MLTIKGLNTSVFYQIVDMTGSVMQSGYTQGSISINSLPSGMFILKTDDNYTVKFVVR